MTYRTVRNPVSEAKGGKLLTLEADKGHRISLSNHDSLGLSIDVSTNNALGYFGAGVTIEWEAAREFVRLADEIVTHHEQRRHVVELLCSLFATLTSTCRYQADPTRYPNHECRTNTGEPLDDGQTCFFEARAQLDDDIALSK